MVVNLSPKGLFLGNAEAAKAHQAIVDSPFFKLGLSLALAQYAQGNPTAESLRGANAFMEIFLNLAEKEGEATAQFPHKSLQQPEEMQAPVPATKPKSP